MAELFQIYGSKNQFLGTGVLVAPTQLLTCEHLVRGQKKLLVQGGTGIAAKVEVVIRHKDLDLALLTLDTHCGEAPQWSQQVADGKQAELSGYVRREDGTVHLRRIDRVLAAHREGDWVESLQAPLGGKEGMSGGVAEVLVGGKVRCIGLIQRGTEDDHATVLAGSGKVARFLARQTPQVVLPGCPAYAGALDSGAVDRDAEMRKRYCARLQRETAQIDIRGFQRSDGKATAFPIGDLYIPLEAEDGERLEELARKHRCLVLQGDAGSGKSTCLQALAHQWAGSGEFLPLPVKVAELDNRIRKSMEQEAGTPTKADDPRWLAMHLAAEEEGKEAALDLGFCQRALLSAKTVVLLDGLDEALSDERRRLMSQLFLKAAEQYKQCRFVLTTRPGVYSGDRQSENLKLAVATIAPLDEAAIETFCANWSRCVYPESLELAGKLKTDLKQQVNAKAEVRELANSPMTLTALAAIHWNEKVLPEDRAELYQSILGWLLRSRERRPGRKGEKESKELLCSLAFGMQTWPEGRLKQVDRGLAAEILCKASTLTAKQARDFLEQEELDSGIIVSRGENVEFRHLTYQEYLAAVELMENRLDEERSWVLKEGRRRYSVEWREFLRLSAILAGKRIAPWMYAVLLEAAGESLADRARTIALVRLLVKDRREEEEAIQDRRYLEYVQQMSGLFEGKADGEGLGIWSRTQAAEAWELLVGDCSRLRLPWEEGYWVDVDGLFDLGRFPVTVLEYREYLKDRPRLEPPNNWERQLKFPQRPVVYVNYPDAVGYCDWASEKSGRVVRIPSSEEWYRAAAGDGESPRDYPWGSAELNPELANYGDEAKQVSPVGLFPAGATPGGGILDLAGNVWDWTSSQVGITPDTRVVRGGSFYFFASYLRASYRYFYEAHFS